MKKSNKFSPEVRARAVRMVQEHRSDYPSLWAAIESIAPKICCVPQTLNEWVKRVQIDTGVRDGVTSAEAQRVKELECEVKELRRANEMLKLASAFFAQAELDRRLNLSGILDLACHRNSHLDWKVPVMAKPTCGHRSVTPYRWCCRLPDSGFSHSTERNASVPASYRFCKN